MGFLYFVVGLFTLHQIASVAGQLEATASDAFEQPCKQISPARNFTSALSLFLASNVYGVYFASESNLRVYASTFLGRPPKDRQEIENMCLSILFAASVAQQRGYGNRTYINFAIPRQVLRGLGTFDFSHQLAHTPGVDTSYQKTSRETVAWSDGKNHALFVRCINNQFMDWKLASTSPPSEEVKSIILDVIESLGFKRELAVDLTEASKNCPSLQSVREFTAQTLRDFRNSRGSSGNGNSNGLKRALVTPITYLQRVYTTLYSLLTGIFNSVRNRSG